MDWRAIQVSRPPKIEGAATLDSLYSYGSRPCLTQPNPAAPTCAPQASATVGDPGPMESHPDMFAFIREASPPHPDVLVNSPVGG